ncbi:LacI family DNA-binding transcriptional regulator [Agrobacterium tumefaciens]|uniref:LacI family DNA-binding transcriptional regulator n=1 Tax=Agrobacterium tumefaciens TaxID=358 RepID=UPI0009CD5C58|nr:LacI family DNA-binding transcriptional regulator [Agrobacterium tumefaciens]AYM19945.1 hypothetical protein At15955_49600 [Agrobacterium tumefaciens]AYM71248.1 hypothetical protein AtA6_50320 [Agrobacterium tumefaciens]NIB58687.1 LacI family transcriptional regulator [Agrobacterium tumefaciens]NSZ25615.1 LacI family transcriptional regulator [Agrobacterium tumefaciens]NTB21704.1 LacI family transcriptional regulator [Agrobacterium tumefaciens]
MANRPTLKEVSSAAGVSVFTASRALADKSGVSAATRDMVVRTAARLGYELNLPASNLRGTKSRCIGILTANSANGFYSRLVGAIQRDVLSAGYTCFVSDAVDQGAYDIARETIFIRALLQQRVAGLVLTYVPTAASLDLLKTWRIPVVFVDCTPPSGFSPSSSVICDGFTASFDVGMRFSQIDRHRWLFVGHSPTWASRASREAGIRCAAHQCRSQLSIVEGGNDVTIAHNRVAAFLNACAPDELPDALFATNEPLLNGSLRAIREAGLRVPDDIAVVGYDDFEWAEQLSPSISVVDQKVEAMGKAAAERILADLVGESVERKNVVMTASFVQRQSTCW